MKGTGLYLAKIGSDITYSFLSSDQVQHFVCDLLIIDFILFCSKVHIRIFLLLLLGSRLCWSNEPISGRYILSSMA